MNKGVLKVEKDILEHFDETNDIEESEVRMNVLRFLEHYDEHLKILMEYERNKKDNMSLVKK